MVGRLDQAIRAGLPEAEIVVRALSPGHFEIEVVSAGFEGLSRVKQQQAVYTTIKHLMAGDAAPVHAIDRMVTRTP
ncbi:MAG: BolA/IbaG family iron-sulfur metabolism protein [Deltaproteobacteria bacterium]|nr:BolA/IbaG family iron-sulfur metabolism protein [Deltaproteobacteria bacterium]MBW2397058.1 BolA/IbaG family iron-sulfur metabolism protein [Deltaproteobacteria bacterium]